MLNLAIVVFLAAGIVLAQNEEALAVQKEDWCFSYIECYETNPECAVEYCNGPPTLGPCTVATSETEPYQVPDAPIRNECCQQSNPYECYRNWAASQSPGSADGSAGLEGNAPVSTSSVIIQSSTIPTKASPISSTSVNQVTTTSSTNPTSLISSALAVTSGSSASETSTQSITSGGSSASISTSAKSATTSIPSTATVNAGPTMALYGYEAGLYVIGGLALAVAI